MPEGGAAAAVGQDETDAAKKKDEQQALAERITQLAAPQVVCTFCPLDLMNLMISTFYFFFDAQVREIESRAATVSWTPVEPVISESTETSVKESMNVDDISYEAVIGQKSGNSKSERFGCVEKCSYRGKECHFR